jgi:hypothetical protein
VGHHEKPSRKRISRVRFEPGTFQIQNTGTDLFPNIPTEKIGELQVR